ncbi:hypothetical protein THAOC_16270, partial [Thalassiosira oceanica]
AARPPTCPTRPPHRHPPVGLPALRRHAPAGHARAPLPGRGDLRRGGRVARRGPRPGGVQPRLRPLRLPPQQQPGRRGTVVRRPGGDEEARRQFPSKVAPPSLGGKKVGVFGTRTPHRPNPVGFSLCRLDGVAVEPRRKRGERKRGGPTFSLLLSGLDVVDGTPVLDVKPYGES